MGGKDATSADDWVQWLIEAVDADNAARLDPIKQSATLAVLRAAPEWAAEHARLALQDFDAAPAERLDALRSDTVARRFAARPVGGGLNVFVARMLVPGGPWPGHFGLEAVVFEAREAVVPGWYPRADGEAEEHPLTFASAIAASAAFRDGHGSVIFPELLATSGRLEAQGFGIVLVDRLERLYNEHVIPAAARLGWAPAENIGDHVREAAFHAHEWGHRAIDAKYSESVTGHRRKLRAVMSEIIADMAALDMLLVRGGGEGGAIAQTLICDRVLREAWLPRRESQVASIVARHLVLLLADAGAIVFGNDPPSFDIDLVAGIAARELASLHDVYKAANAGDDDSTMRYLAGYGWQVEGRQMRQTRDHAVFDRLERYIHVPGA